MKKKSPVQITPGTAKYAGTTRAVLTQEEAGPLSDHELLIPATRYYMGRMTIAATTHARALATHWSALPQHIRAVIRRDLEEAFHSGDALRADPAAGAHRYPLGSDLDRAAWEAVRQAWTSHDDVSAHPAATASKERLRE